MKSYSKNNLTNEKYISGKEIPILNKNSLFELNRKMRLPKRFKIVEKKKDLILSLKKITNFKKFSKIGNKIKYIITNLLFNKFEFLKYRT